MQTIVVAGGAGFIGSHLCKELLAKGNAVICIDNFLTSDRSNLEDLQKNTQFRFVEHDITKPLNTLTFPAISAIYHLASPASPNKNSPRSYISFPIETLLANSVGTYQLLMLAKQKGAKLLYASTSEVYGDPTVSPQNETYFGNVNPNGVRSVYDEGKRFGEAMSMAFVRKYDVDARIVRIFNTFGPSMQKDDGRVVSNFITQALVNKPIVIYGEGTQTRSFCYIDDMIDGLCRLMDGKNTKGEVVNLGNPNERTVADLATIILEMTESFSEIVHEELSEDDPKKRCPDIKKAKALLGWEPKVSLAEGLEKTIAYFKNQI